MVDRAHRAACAVPLDPHVLPEIVQQRLQHGDRRCRQEVPLEPRMGRKAARVAAQLRRGVVGRVEADADEAHVRAQVGIGHDAAAQSGHQPERVRTAERIGAVRVEERQQRDLAAGQRRQLARTPSRVQQLRIGTLLDALQLIRAGRRGHELHSRRAGQPGIRCSHCCGATQQRSPQRGTAARPGEAQPPGVLSIRASIPPCHRPAPRPLLARRTSYGEPVRAFPSRNRLRTQASTPCRPS